MPINECNDSELCRWRSAARDSYEKLDRLAAEGRADALWIEYHRLSNAAEKAKERLNEIKYTNNPPKVPA